MGKGLEARRGLPHPHPSFYNPVFGLCLQRTLRDLKTKILNFRSCNPRIKLSLCLSCFLDKGNRSTLATLLTWRLQDWGEEGSISRPRWGAEKMI